MFGKLKELFGAKSSPTGPRKPAASSPAKLRRSNLDRRFSIIAETGQGSMSKVYRALDKQNGRVVCLKVQDREKTTAAIARSQQTGRPSEGEIGMKISHPHVVKTFEFGQSTRGEYFLVMEFIDGVPLNALRATRPLTLPQKVDFLVQTAEGLAAVHRAGFIHHDFGCKNALVNQQDQVKIIDFGLAVPNTPTFQRPGNRTGTLEYMAPELLRREATDEKLDIFSFGATAFEFLTGRLPYENAPDRMAQIRLRMNSDPLDLAQVAPHLPEGLCRLINKTLTRRKEDRWPAMSSLAQALREFGTPPEE